MKKLLVVLVLGLAWCGVSEATGARGAKKKTVINYSATASLACSGRCTVYSLWASTGATTDFTVLRDSGTANTSSSPTASIAGATATATYVFFDPPIIFDNGVSLNCAATSYCGVATQRGVDVTSGY